MYGIYACVPSPCFRWKLVFVSCFHFSHDSLTGHKNVEFADEVGLPIRLFSLATLLFVFNGGIGRIEGGRMMLF